MMEREKMIKRNLKKWENISDMQGMLYFVQRMDELLFHYSMDTYKVPTLNVKLLLQEYLNTVDSIKEGQLKDKNEVPVFEEIVWCLENDKIAQRVIGQSICEEFLKNNGSYDKGMKRKVCQLFLDKLTGKKYLEELEEELRNVIINNSKKQIDSYARNFVRELTVLGYNSRYIFSRLNKIFYNSAVSDFSSMDMFFECFECKNKNYSVYLTIDKELAKFSGLLGEKLPQDSFCVLEDDDIPRGIQKIDGYNVVEIKNIRAYDEYSAYESAKNVIGLLDHFYSFFRYTGNGVYKNGFVKSDSGIKFIKEEVSGAERAKRTKSFEKSSLGALDLFNKATMNYENLYKLSRIMEIHNMALGIKSPSNVLLGLWSILELLLEKGETDNDHSRIFNIIDLVLPYLKNSYVEKLTLNLLLDLQRWDKRELKSILARITVGTTDVEKLFAFVSLKCYEEERKKFYSKLESFPLLRFRVYSLNDQFKKKNNIVKMISEHEKKVKWHLQRIYRARNCIIHDGDEISNIENLVENLLSYVDIISERIIQKLGKGGVNYTVSDAIVEEILQAKEFEILSETLGDVNEENFTIFLYHGKKEN